MVGGNEMMLFDICKSDECQLNDWRKEVEELNANQNQLTQTNSKEGTNTIRSLHQSSSSQFIDFIHLSPNLIKS
jgi:hypothetical protein